MSGKTPKTAVLMSVNDTFGTAMIDGIKAMFPKLDMPYEIVETISYDPAAKDLSVEVAKAKATKAEMLMPVCRLNDAKLLVQEMVKQRWEPMGVMNPGAPGLYEQDFLKTMGKYGDFLISNVPWLDPKSAMTQALEKRHAAKFPDDQLDINGGFTFEAMLIAAQAWLAAKSTKADALMEALRKTKIDQHVMVGGPIQFDAKGQNVNIKAAAVAESQAQADRRDAAQTPPRRRWSSRCRAGTTSAGLEHLCRPERMTADFLLSLAQAITKGLLTGMVYGLMALGLSVIFGVMRVVNFAHGEMMVVGMYLAWMGFEYLEVSPLLSLPVIAVLFFFAGYALQRSLISPFIGRPEHQQFLLLLAVAILLVNACLAIAGPDSRGVQLDSQFDSYELGPLVFDAVRLHAAIAAVAIAGLLWLFFTRTRTGKSIRAAADNNMGALVVGLDVRRLYAFTFGVGAACVGAAGALMITIIPVTPFLAARIHAAGLRHRDRGRAGQHDRCADGRPADRRQRGGGGPAAAALAQEHVQLRAPDPGPAAPAAGPVRQEELVSFARTPCSISWAMPHRAPCGASPSCSRSCWWRRRCSASTGSPS